jgi:glycosyltransferase involved in cell wall biosynthesis
MKILAVAPYIPHEAVRHAGGVYLLRHLRELTRRGNHVSLLVPGSPGQLAALPFAPHWLEVITGPPSTADRGVGRVLLDAAYRRAMLAPPAPSAESLRSIRRAGLVRRAATADIVELHWAEYARFATVIRQAGVRTPISVIEHDVDLEAGAERARTHATGYRRRLGLLTAPLVRKLERDGLDHADLVAVFKSADEDVIRRAGVRTAVQLLDPWLEEPPDIDGPRRPKSVLVTGALWRPENATGILWFLEHVWPRVSAAVPDAVLQLVGAGAGAELVAGARAASNVQLVGEVPEMLPYYLDASVFVAPLFTSGGLKFKVPQAMLCGLPVVATTVAADGVKGLAPDDAIWCVTDDAAQMADAIKAALLDADAAAAVGRRAAHWCHGRYSFPESLARLNTAYQQLAASP